MIAHDVLYVSAREQRAMRVIESAMRDAWRDLQDARRYGTRREADVREYALRDLCGIRRALQGR